MTISRKQAHFFKYSNAKINIAEGAVRSGKTFIVNLRWIKYIKEAPPGKLLMSGRTLASLKENVLEDLFAVVGKDNYKYKESSGELILFGRKIRCIGADNIEAEKKIRGQTYAGWYGDEITIQHKAFVKQAITRCSAPGAKIFWTTNPDHPKHYIKTDFMDNEEMKEKKQVKVWSFFLTDNNTLTDDYKDLLRASFSGVFYMRNIEGKWVIAEGVVYGDYYKPTMKISRAEADRLLASGVFKEFIGGTDWGYTHPMTGYLVGVSHDDVYYCIDEFYATQKRTEDLRDWYLGWEEKLSRKISYIFCDSAEPDRITTLKASGLRAVGAQKEIMAGINSVQTTMKNNRWFIVAEACPGADLEFTMYRYPDEDESKSTKDQPLDEDNHAMDAIRYLIHNYELIRLKREKAETKKGSRPNSARPTRRTKKYG